MKDKEGAEPRLVGRPQWRSVGGQEVPDPFLWLEDPDPGLAETLWAAEAAFSRAALAPIASLTDEIERELWARVDIDDTPPPVLHGPYIYWSERDAGTLHLKHYRRDRSGGESELILDEGDLPHRAAGSRVEFFVVSPDHRQLLAGLDLTGGTERLTLCVREVSGRRWLDCVAEGVASAGLAWAQDSEFYYCVLLDSANRPWRAVRRQATDPRHQEDVFRTERPDVRLRLRSGEAGRHILITATSHETSEIWAVQQTAGATPRRIAESVPGRRVYAVEGRDGFYMLVSFDDGTSEIRYLPHGAEAPERETELYSAAEHEPITALQAFRTHLLLFQRVDGQPRLRVLDLSSGALSDVPVPVDAMCCHPGDNREFDTTEIRFGWDGPATPYVHARYGLEDGRTEIILQQRLPGCDLGQFDVDRHLVPSYEAEVPVSLLLPADRRGPVPMLFYVYGSYGLPIEDRFSILPLHLVEHGIGYAVCHVRGGGEFGPRWWKDGAGHAKINGIRDFLACLDHLVEAGLAEPTRLGAMAESAGAFLVAAAMNRRPGLIRLAVLDCPFLDPLAILGDPEIPFTPSEWSEWGNPSRPDDFKNLLALSPYAGVGHHVYPDVLVYLSAMDLRTPAWEGMKWAAKLRGSRRGSGSVILKRRADAGHHGEADPKADMREWAEKLAFVRHGLKSCPSGRQPTY